MDKQGNKTGGRKKGTPNRVNASVKVRIKDFLIKTEDAMMEAFMNAKPNERLNFWFKMANFICAKQTSSKDDGEWRPGEGIIADWEINDDLGLNDNEEQYSENEEKDVDYYAISSTEATDSIEPDELVDSCESRKYDDDGENNEPDESQYDDYTDDIESAECELKPKPSLLKTPKNTLKKAKRKKTKAKNHKRRRRA